MDILTAYQKAADLYNLNLKKCVMNESPKEQWIEETEDFWYIKDVEYGEKKIGTQFIRYRYEDNSEEALFDHEALAKLISPYCTKKPSVFDLPIEIKEYDEKAGKIYLAIKGAVGEFCCDTELRSLERIHNELHAQAEVLSPDKKHSLYIVDHNIMCRNNQTCQTVQLTFDGEQNLDYGLRFEPVSGKLITDNPDIYKPGIVWSPNSRYFITYRTDRRLLGKLYLMQSVPKDGSPRPRGVEYPYALPGDEHILEGQVYIGDIKNKTVRKVLLKEEPVVLYLLALFTAEGREAKWTEDGKSAYFVRYDRYFKHIQCIAVNAATARARVLFQESYDTFGFVEYYGSASQEHYSEPSICYMPKTKELIWHSEAEGWGAFYLYDTGTRRLVRKLTNGQWTARRLKHVDEEARMAYFTAGGREEGVDPYYQILYRVSLDGGEPERVTPEDMEHYIRFSPHGMYFLDTCSTIQTAPVMSVREPDGRLRKELTRANLSRIQEKGYIVPEPFTALARDGVTAIYGILIKPAGFDPSKKYPVIDYIYGGSQRINTPKAFEFNVNQTGTPQGDLQNLAQLGFVGIIVDGFATPLRSKKIHDYGYGKTEECCGLEEHILAVRQLAGQYSWIDETRVGIWGASGGGYATVRAMLAYPDFYKVGVSLCGNHD